MEDKKVEPKKTAVAEKVDKEKEGLKKRVAQLEKTIESHVLVTKAEVEEIRELLRRSCRQSNNVPFRQQLKRLLSTFGR